jgi:DNA-entry nuclease
MNDSNQDSMLYYENRLDSWLATHPNYWLDYLVTPIYQGDELIPRQVKLQYVGLDQDGQLLPINIGGKESTDSKGITTVLLDNVSPNADINYLTGTATNTVGRASAQSQTYNAPASSSSYVTPAPATQNNSRTVYVTGGGTSDVYWYGTERMPANTNRANIITMTEGDALAKGKRHSLRE